MKDQNAAPTYFVTQAKVPHYTVANNVIIQAQDAKGAALYDPVWVALLAIHVAFTLPGHPEMIWSSFEHVHVDSAGNATRDNAPSAPANPKKTPDNTIISTTDYPLYTHGTAASEANSPLDPKIMAQHFDESTQSFIKGGVLKTSVYRPYPGSKSDGPAPVPGQPSEDFSAEDEDVIRINNNATALFDDERNLGLSRSDLRENYRLVGAVWIDRPDLNFQQNGKPYVNPPDHTTDEPNALLAGEGRLASTAMESFTETEDLSPNCFSCHDTRAVRNDVTQTQILPPAFLNVSHILSRFKDQSLSKKP